MAGTTHTIRQCRPDEQETKLFWKLFHAANRCDNRWGGWNVSEIAEELSGTQLDRAQKLFLLRAWQVLVDDGCFSRFMGAFDTYVHNMQDPADDCVAWKPSLVEQFRAAELLPVVMEAYQEARQRIAELATPGIIPVRWLSPEDAQATYPAPAPAIDEQALELSRRVMHLLSERQLGGAAQLQAKIQCLIAEALKECERG